VQVPRQAKLPLRRVSCCDELHYGLCWTRHAAIYDAERVAQKKLNEIMTQERAGYTLFRLVSRSAGSDTKLFCMLAHVREANPVLQWFARCGVEGGDLEMEDPARPLLLRILSKQRAACKEASELLPREHIDLCTSNEILVDLLSNAGAQAQALQVDLLQHMSRGRSLAGLQVTGVQRIVDGLELSAPEVVPEAEAPTAGQEEECDFDKALKVTKNIGAKGRKQTSKGTGKGSKSSKPASAHDPGPEDPAGPDDIEDAFRLLGQQAVAGTPRAPASAAAPSRDDDAPTSCQVGGDDRAGDLEVDDFQEWLAEHQSEVDDAESSIVSGEESATEIILDHHLIQEGIRNRDGEETAEPEPEVASTSGAAASSSSTAGSAPSGEDIGPLARAALELVPAQLDATCEVLYLPSSLMASRTSSASTSKRSSGRYKPQPGTGCPAIGRITTWVPKGPLKDDEVPPHNFSAYCREHAGCARIYNLGWIGQHAPDLDVDDELHAWLIAAHLPGGPCSKQDRLRKVQCTTRAAQQLAS